MKFAILISFLLLTACTSPTALERARENCSAQGVARHTNDWRACVYNQRL